MNDSSKYTARPALNLETAEAINLNASAFMITSLRTINLIEIRRISQLTSEQVTTKTLLRFKAEKD